MTNRISTTKPLHGIWGVLLSLAFTSAPLFVTAQQNSVVYFSNVHIFDGKSDKLSEPSNVLVRGNKIERISVEPIPTDRRADTVLIDGGGRTLMPGLIDNHWHAMLVRPTPVSGIVDDIGYNTLVAGDEATDTLMRGFTTVRDVGGPAFGLKRAIDEGIVAGPRIYPSGAVITITSGHGDFRQLYEVPRKIGDARSRVEQIGASMIADSPDEVRLRVREQLMLGATQIKLTGGGRRCFAPQPTGRLHLHRTRASCGRRSGRELGHLRHRSCLHHGLDPAGDRRGREVYRARPSHG